MERRVRREFRKYEALIIVLTVLAILITIIGVVVVARAEKTEVAAQVLASDELTTYHPELEAHFTYAHEEVTHLWKLKVRFVNSGDKTIVGVGSQKNIIGDGVNFVFPDKTRILRIEEEADTFDSTIVQPKPNHFQIQFSQWRSGEYSIVSFCVASDKPLDVDPLPMAPTRDIVDGDIIVEDLTERRPLERITMIDRLPAGMSMSGKVIGGFVAGVLVIGLIILLAWGWMDTVKKFMWKRRYLTSFLNYLDQVEPRPSKSQKGKFKKEPDRLPDELWANFEGKKIPVGGLAFDTKLEATLFTIISFIMVFGFISLILMLFPA